MRLCFFKVIKTINSIFRFVQKRLLSQKIQKFIKILNKLYFKIFNYVYLLSQGVESVFCLAKGRRFESSTRIFF